jgi:hypothetical protein
MRTLHRHLLDSATIRAVHSSFQRFLKLLLERTIAALIYDALGIAQKSPRILANQPDSKVIGIAVLEVACTGRFVE